MSKISYNLNDYVEAKITDSGKKALKEYYDKKFPGMDLTPTIKEDAEGWSRWQMWDFMRNFGHLMGLGCVMPCSTEIRFEPTPNKE